MLEAWKDNGVYFATWTNEKNEVRRLGIEEAAHFLAEQSPQLAAQNYSALISEARKWVLLTSKPWEEPSFFAYANEPEKRCYKRLDFSPSPGATPAWDEFLERLGGAAEDFLAYIGSIYTPQHSGRQVLYLYGKGATGKSNVIKAVASSFGHACASINQAQVKHNKRFLLSSLVGKPLVIYPDCTNPKFVMSEFVRTISSGDIVPVENKGEKPYSAVMKARLMVASNYAPEISFGTEDTSRLVPIHVAANKAPGNDPNWQARLQAELPHLIHKSLQVYAEKCPNHGAIQLSQRTLTQTDTLAGIFNEEFEHTFSEWFVADANGRVPAYQLRDRVAADKGWNDFKLADFKKYLADRHGAEVRRGSKGIVYHGLDWKNKSLAVVE